VALRQFADVPLTTMVDVPAAGPGLTLVVGAGISVEAGLPPWRQLVRDLLDRAARERLGLTDPPIREAWIDQVLRGESPLGAAAVAEALAGDDLANWIPDALYGADPRRFQPGPIARQVPVLRQAFGIGLRLLTTNYDDLLQQAFEDAGIGVEAAAFTGPEGSSAPATDAANQRISHLHGFLARDGRREGTVVLTEHDYQRVAQSDWQRSEVGAALMNSPCIFIGSSLTDPNLLRYLHTHSGPGSPRHFAIFTRQDVYPRGTPQQVIAAREKALAARWRSNNLAIVFVDHYAEIALTLAEVARAKQQGDEYVLLPQRLGQWHARVARELLLPPGNGAFIQAQDLLHGALRGALEAAVQTVNDLGYDTGDEVLAATLWLVDEAGDTLTNWATTDRVHRDPATIDPVPITEHSSWVAVRAFCRGAALGEPRDIYASRWKYIRGLPLNTANGVPVGALTVASMLPEGKTMLDHMPDTIEAAFDAALRQVALDILDMVFESE
jgi:SIR2-like domain